MAKLEPRPKDRQPLNIAIFGVLCYNQCAFELPFFSVVQKIKIARSKAAFVANFQVFQLPLKNSSSSWYHNLKICIHAQHASLHKRKLSTCLENIFFRMSGPIWGHFRPFGPFLGHWEVSPAWLLL